MAEEGETEALSVEPLSDGEAIEAAAAVVEVKRRKGMAKEGKERVRSEYK